MIKYIHPREAAQMILSLPKMFGWSSALEETPSREFFYHSTSHNFYSHTKSLVWEYFHRNFMQKLSIDTYGFETVAKKGDARCLEKG